MDLQSIIHLLGKECDYPIRKAIISEFVKGGKLVKLNSGKPLINAGEFDDNIYVVAEGIIRFSDMNGESERTFAFGQPGTMFMSKHSFVKGRPSYYQIDACCPTVLLQIPSRHYWKLVDTYHEFAVWALHMAQEELFFQEVKNAVINGDAKERFNSLLKNRPEIIGQVQQKIIASYLGVTPQYYCRLKRQAHINNKK